MIKPDDLDSLIAERSQTYGPYATSMESIGLIWTGLLQHHYNIRLDHPIPPHVSALMLASMKICRATAGWKEDNFHDLAAFARFAEELQRESQSSNGHMDLAQSCSQVS